MTIRELRARLFEVGNQEAEVFIETDSGQPVALSEIDNAGNRVIFLTD